MADIEIKAHEARGYGPRTYANAAAGDVTIAVAADYSTAGERLTRKAAGLRYLALPLRDDPVANARRLYRHLNDRGMADKVINVAGNGMHTLSRHGFTQGQVDDYMHRLLAPVHEHLGIGRVISGGQTGIDMAGAVAAARLDIPVGLLLPAGFRQRDSAGTDHEVTEAQVLSQIEEGVARLASDRDMPDP